MEEYKTPIDRTLETINAVLGRNLTETEIQELIDLLVQRRSEGPVIISDGASSSRAYKVIKSMLSENDIRQLMIKLKASLPVATITTEPVIKNAESKLEISPVEKIKQEEIDNRIVITGTFDGFTSFDTTNSKNIGAGASYDVRPVNDPGRYHFYHNYEEVSRKWNKENKPFTFIYSRDGKKYLYASAGLGTYYGKSENGRYGNVFVSIELREDLPSWTEEYILKKAIDIANQKFAKDLEKPVEFKEEYLSKFIV